MRLFHALPDQSAPHLAAPDLGLLNLAEFFGLK